MEIIQNNPFRIIGLMAGANAKDLAKQRAKINAYLGVGKELEFETDFPILGRVTRDNGAIDTAFASIQQNANKVLFGLFWFVDGSYVDEPAIGYIREGDVSRAEETWSKLAGSGELSHRNFSAFTNLGTLKLALAFSGNGHIDVSKLEEGVSLKLQLLQSAEFKNFAQLVADPTYPVDLEMESRRFVDECYKQMQPFLNKAGGIPIGALPGLFKAAGSDAQKYLLSKVSGPLAHALEERVEAIKKKRADFPENGHSFGEQLFEESQQQLQELKAALGSGHPQYQLIADKVANEVLNCGVNFFQALKENPKADPGPPAMALFLKARKIAVGPLAKDRVAENIQGLQEWIDSKPAREKEQKIASDLVFIGNKLNNYQKQSNNHQTARELVLACKPKLQNIRSILGASDELYVQLSSTVGAVALGTSVAIVNQSQEGLAKMREPNLKFLLLTQFRKTIGEAIDLVALIAQLDLDNQQRQRLQSSRSTLLSIKNQFDQLDRQIASPSSSGSGGGGACYIATMAYGDYSHPQVMVLRQFRDEVLAKNLLGRKLIDLYYAVSPTLVYLFKDQAFINRLLRSWLDVIVNNLKKKL